MQVTPAVIVCVIGGALIWAAAIWFAATALSAAIDARHCAALGVERCAPH